MRLVDNVTTFQIDYENPDAKFILLTRSSRVRAINQPPCWQLVDALVFARLSPTVLGVVTVYAKTVHPNQQQSFYSPTLVERTVICSAVQ